MERTSKDVAAYLGSLEGRQGDDMRALDAAIVESMPGRERHLYEGTFWGGSDQQIIGYGVLDYQDRSGKQVEWFLVGLAAQKKYISVYVNASEDGVYLLRQYEGRLGKVKTGSASISLTTLEDVDLVTLLELVSRAHQIGEQT